MTDDELREMLALAAVGALTDDEQTELDAALAERPDLRAELDGLREVATTMADAVAEAPPAGLRARVLDTIAHTPQLAPEPPAAEPADAPLAPVVPIGRRRRWVAVGAAAAAVVALVAGVLIASPFDDDGGDDQVAAVVDADDAQTIEMPGDLPGLTIVYSAGEDAAVLLADRGPGAGGRQRLRAVGDPRRHARVLRHVPSRRRRPAERLRRRPRPGQRRGLGDHRGAGRRLTDRAPDVGHPQRHGLSDLPPVLRGFHGHIWP